MDRGLWVRDRQLYVCMYVRHAFGMQLLLSACAMTTLFVLQIMVGGSAMIMDQRLSSISLTNTPSMILHLGMIRNGIACEALAKSDKYLN